MDEQSKNFYVSGEIKSKFDLMPLDQVELEVVLLPLFIGTHYLPPLYLIDRKAHPDLKSISTKKLNDGRSGKKTEDLVDYQFLLKACTLKVFVES